MSEISSITESKTEEVYDIEMPKHHNFFANGVLAHNCHQTPWEDVIRYYQAKKDGAVKALNHEIAKIDATKSEEEIKVARSIQKTTPHLVYHEKSGKLYPETQYARILVHFLNENPKVRIIGYTGSPYRGKVAIKDAFWKEQLSSVDTMTLVSMGYLVPPAFGFGDDEHSYDLSEFELKGEHGTEDYTAEQLRAMQRKITKDLSKTQIIINEIVEKTKDRNGVLITCAGQKHCQQVAECLPEGTWAIVTDKTPTSERRMILEKAKQSEIKYVIQIGCLTTGVNVPVWDTCVILRKIGSLTLLVQLIGRVLRTLKDEHLEKGIEKRDGLVLDYAGTLSEMGDIYDDPVLNKATVKLATINKSHIICPACEGANNPHAVRCAHHNSGGERCDYYFKSKECDNCQTQNAPTAEVCRGCGQDMIDINKRLMNKAYSDDEFKPVKSMTFEKDTRGNLWVNWEFDSTMFVDGVEVPETGRQLFPLASKKPAVRQMWKFFVLDHVVNKAYVGKCIHGSTDEIIALSSQFEIPEQATHRVNDKNKSVITRKIFRGGRRNYK